MKLNISILVLIFFTCICTAQKKTVAITAFEKTNTSIADNYIKAIEDKVKEALYTTNRFEIVDRTNMSKLKEEMELQKSEEFMDGNVVEQSSLNGAEQMVAGSVSQVSITKRITEKTTYYDCSISFSLQVIDVATGQVVASELIRPKQSFFAGIGSNLTGGNATPEKAFFSSLKGTQNAIDKFVGNNFPMTTVIIEVLKTSSNKAKSLLINTGTSQGAKKNQKFVVIELIKKEVNGKTLIHRKELGSIKLTKIEGEEISEAKVLKGGEEILAKFNAGSKIECYSKS